MVYLLVVPLVGKWAQVARGRAEVGRNVGLVVGGKVGETVGAEVGARVGKKHSP